ncbi:MAG: amylo-alpha-1,6-glucosidase [Candidatus Latescibacterota bacterium]
MNRIVRSMLWSRQNNADIEPLLIREWLITNGLGGYASGTVSGVITRRYHGILVAAMPAPLGRMMMLNYLSEQIRFPDGRTVSIGGEEAGQGYLSLPVVEYLAEFRLENGLPVWIFDIDGMKIERRILMLHMQNTTQVAYRMLSGKETVQLELLPAMHIRPHDRRLDEPFFGEYSLTVIGKRYEINARSGLPILRITTFGDQATFTIQSGILKEIYCRIEAERGYECRGTLWSPGFFTLDLAPDRTSTLVASTESWNTILALNPDEAFRAEDIRRKVLIDVARVKENNSLEAELVMAADQFIISPAGRAEDSARAHASGDEIRTVIAGYHWFTDWGRDTMISLEGLTLTTGRYNEAGWILRTFAHYIRNGLIPNLFPEGERGGLYHTADATLWFFHAIDRYLEVTGDPNLLPLLLPSLADIIEHHVKGTRFGIGVDPSDGLLRQGQKGYQLTWMDAKVGDWVVTPRRGKAVEINALWYNALRLMEHWVNREQGEEEGRKYAEYAERARLSFNRRFWYEEGQYLYDVVDAEQGGNDPSLRPNQVLALSLKHPILERDRWEPVLSIVEERLATPVGLRSLAPGSPEYKAKYFGDLRSRDAAYHQGTVWAWLIGPFIDAWLKVHPDDRAGARRFLEGFNEHLNEACVGSISEVFDADEPYIARGCVAQAWSVAEVLRCLRKTGE